MPSFEHSIDVAAPFDQVFAFGRDPENWLRTMPSLSNIEIVEETADGLRLKGTYQILGRSLHADMELEIDEPNGHMMTRFDSPGMTGELHYRFSETDDGTHVVQECEYEFGDSFLERILEPVAKRYNERQFKHSLATTKELIEAEVAASVEA